MSVRIAKNIETAFKKVLHFPFFILFRKGDSSKYPVDPEKINSILILRPDKLGDMIVTVPVIHAIKEKFPHIRLEVVASPKNKIIIENDPNVDGLHLYRKNISKDAPLIAKLRKAGFDIVYDAITLDSVTGLLLTRLIGKKSVWAASRKMSFSRYYDYCEKYDPNGRDHNIDNGMLIFKVLGIDPHTIDPFRGVYIPENSKKKADLFFRSIPGENNFFVGLNISAGSASRTLPVQKYISILNLINKKNPEFKFIILSIMAEREKAVYLKENSPAGTYLIPENMTLLDAAAILGRLNILISPDTSMIHIARLMNIPVVGLYSGHGRNINSWRPYGQEHGVVKAHNIQNLHDIEPETVVKEFEKVLADVESSAIKNK